MSGTGLEGLQRPEGLEEIKQLLLTVLAAARQLQWPSRLNLLLNSMDWELFAAMVELLRRVSVCLGSYYGASSRKSLMTTVI